MVKHYNPIERAIARKLEAFPQMKLILKKTYQYFNFYLHHKSYTIKANYAVNELSDGRNETFFGYYDKSPVNETNEFVIFQSTEYSTKKLPNPEIPIQVALYDIANKRIINKFNTRTYNWQQGSKLQWISAYEFIFNCIEEEENYQSCIVDAQKNTIKRVIPYAIYDVYDNYGLTVNFDRLAVLRPDYGYRNHINIAFDITDIKNDGIYRIDFENNKQELIISIELLNALYPADLLKKNNVSQKVNHIMISPNGERFIFLHRYFVNGRKLDRLFLSDISGKNIVLLNDNEMVSHCCWYGNDKIVGYMRRYDNGDGYYIIDLNTLEIKPFGGGLIDKFGDGHPSICNNKMLFDTYPNKARMKELYSYDLISGKLDKIGEFYESFKYYGETRCDLHPRWSYDGSMIFFDSVHTGKRQLYMIEYK